MRKNPASLSGYVRGIALLVRHPSILAMPLVAALVDMLVSTTSGAMTDPLGGLGSGLFAMIVQIVYLFAFGVAIIQANDLLRGYRGTFDQAWEEARKKAGGIILAAIGFQFVSYFFGYAASILGLPGVIGLVLQLVAYFFLILTMPAAAIGGLPGGLAISGSFRAVRARPLACIILAVVFVALWVFVPQLLVNNVGPRLDFIELSLVRAAVSAVVLAYLAFPFAQTYEETAFRGLW